MTRPITTRLRAFAIAASTLPFLAACGNDPDAANALNQVKSLFTLPTAAKAPAQQVTPEVVQQVLASTTGSVALVTIEKTKAPGFIVEIGQNGPYRTFATSARQTVVMKSGMITATRGLGSDLMSSDIDAVLALVQGRKSGQATRIMRFLDGVDQERDLPFNCTVTSSGKTATESCAGGNLTFENSYTFGPGGQIVSSRQWVGRLTGTLAVQMLR